jgi:hypothetical protein
VGQKSRSLRRGAAGMHDEAQRGRHDHVVIAAVQVLPQLLELGGRQMPVLGLVGRCGDVLARRGGDDLAGNAEAKDPGPMSPAAASTCPRRPWCAPG